MPIINIIDRRTRHYRFKKINAIAEPAWHDNCCTDADQTTIGIDDAIGYEQKEHVTLTFAVGWAHALKANVTLYLYDSDDGVYLVDPKDFAMPEAKEIAEARS